MRKTLMNIDNMLRYTYIKISTCRKEIIVKKYHAIVIGMGPAGMAVSAMGAALGLDILAVEERKVGGECLNVGCIPSKALLKASEVNFSAFDMKQFGIDSDCDLTTDTHKAMEVVRGKVDKINNKKMMKAFDGVKLVLNEGPAEFRDRYTIVVNGKKYRAKKIFIATGTEPAIPSIPGIEKLTDDQLLTNLNIFNLEKFPHKMTILGGGAIGTEMAQAFSRLGTKVTIVQMGGHLLPAGDKEAGDLLQTMFEKEGIKVFNSTRIEKIEVKEKEITTYTDKGNFVSEKILVAAGRKPVLDSLKLEKAGVRYTKQGIVVDRHMRTNIGNIYAVGDCNGLALLSHAAMHQGMLALMNAINPTPFKFKRNKYYVPWSVFTKPEVAQVGLKEHEAREKRLNIEIIKRDFVTYGRTVADGHPEGFIKIITNKKGRILGVTIVGESASEIIHEWILAIQKKLTMFDIMMMQHSFPTIAMINKMAAEDWMMKKMKNPSIRKIARFFM